jgi:hypothetical protein
MFRVIRTQTLKPPELKIIGFRNPMSHFEPLAARCMSHLAHNPDNSWTDSRVLFSKILTIEVWQDLEIAHPGAASTRRHYQSHHETRSLLQAMGGDPAPPIAAPRTFRRRDRSISFGFRPSRRQDIIFALSSPTHFSVQPSVRWNSIPRKKPRVSAYCI